MNRIMEIFETHYVSGDFAEIVNSFLEDLKSKKEETYRKAEFIVKQMLNNIDAIESFLRGAESQLLHFRFREQVCLVYYHSYYHLASFPEDSRRDRHLLHSYLSFLPSCIPIVLDWGLGGVSQNRQL